MISHDDMILKAPSGNSDGGQSEFLLLIDRREGGTEILFWWQRMIIVLTSPMIDLKARLKLFFLSSFDGLVLKIPIG